MKNIIQLILMQLLLVFLYVSCEKRDEIIHNDNISTRSVFNAYIDGDDTFKLNDEKTYYLRELNSSYTVKWEVLNATIMENNRTSIKLKFDIDISTVNIKVNITDNSTNQIATIYKNITQPLGGGTASKILIEGPNIFCEDEMITYKLIGLSESIYQNISWSSSNPNALSIISVTPIKGATGGTFSNNAVIKRNTKAGGCVYLEAKYKQGGGPIMSYSKKIDLCNLNALNDVELIVSEIDFNTNKAELFNLPDNVVTSWEVIGNGFIPYFQSTDKLFLSVNDDNSQSIIKATMTVNGQTRYLSKVIKPNQEIDVTLIFNHIGSSNSGYADISIQNQKGITVFENEFDSYGGSVSSHTIKLATGRYYIYASGSPNNPFHQSFDIIRSDYGINRTTLLINLDAGDQYFTISFTKPYH